jgi:hypothetical protein
MDTDMWPGEIRIAIAIEPFLGEILLQTSSPATERMTTPIQQPPPTRQAARMIHGAMVVGVIMFAIVSHFVLVPKANPAGGLAPLMPLLLGLSLAGCAVGTLLSYRVPRMSSGESRQAFWFRAFPKAIVSWALIEGAALLAVVVYGLTASRAAIAVAGIVILVFALLNPRYFERRS